MRKRAFAIYAVLVVLIVLLAVLGLSCPTGFIEVNATLCGVPWQGAVNYTLTPTGGSPVNGSGVPTTHSSMAPGTWTCAYVSGGPAGAFLNSIKPSASQSLVAGGTITFNLDFEKDQDAAIEFLTWTRDGQPVHSSEVSANVCQIIDAHFQQWVDGCLGHNVTLNETSWLKITQIAGPPWGAMITVVDDWCAVNKTPEPPDKLSQVASINNATVHQGYSFNLSLNMTTLLDVETTWELVKCVNYTKAINWLGISKAPFVPGVHPCVLFELVLPPGPMQQYTFILQTSASVALADDVDANGNNNNTGWSPVLILTVTG